MDSPTSRKIAWADILLFPFRWLITAPPTVALLTMLILVIGVGTFLLKGTGYFPFYQPLNFQSLVINPDFTTITNPDGSYFQISYERALSSEFRGLVRHASPIQESKFPILSHDILVTSGDYADPQKVTTSVFNHHFFWQSQNSQPAGTINLLHTVPANADIDAQLATIRSGTTILIKGREILRIDSFTPNKELVQWWQDSGCNTLIVSSVEIFQ